MTFQMYDYQQESVDALMKHIHSGKGGNPLIVAPTGAGKSVIVANIIDKLLAVAPTAKITMLVHTKELIEQNAECFHEWFPMRSYGICAAGLNRRDTTTQVTFGQIQTMGNKKTLEKVQTPDVLLIDEAHWGMAEKGTMYNKLIDKFKAAHPNLLVIGLTATPFTMKGGSLLNNGVFTDIVYEIGLLTLIKRGVLCEPITVPGDKQADMSNVRKTGGDYNISEMFDAFHKDNVTVKALDELIERGKTRNKWLLFCVNIAHVEEVTAYLNAKGIHTASVTGEMNKSQRNTVINDYKNGKYKALVNCDVLTTGFNVKDIDMIGMLRATKSAGLWLQIVGRGMRTHPSKTDCLVLDFGNNISEFGPIDKLKINEKKKSPRDSNIVKGTLKICPNHLCKATNPTAARKCKVCGTEFPKADGIININTYSSNGAILSVQESHPDEIKFDAIAYVQHTKISTKSKSMKVVYRKGGTMFREFLAFGNPRAAFKCNKWWRDRCDLPVPETTEEAVKLAKEGYLRVPDKILVRKQGKFPTIVAYDFNGEIIKG